VQPNEPGVGCVYLHWEGHGHPHNGIGDFPCKVFTATSCFSAASICDGCKIVNIPCRKAFICLQPIPDVQK